MSIRAEIWHRVAEGRLVELRPPVGTPMRRMYLETSLSREISAEREDVMMDRYAQLEADLGVFVSSTTLDPSYLYLLSPTRDKVWEIRSVDPLPQFRIFGMFAAKDIFIATHHEFRDHLGDFESDAWKIAKRRAVGIWRQLFSGYRAMNSTDIDDLVTGAINGKYFRD